MPPANTSFGTAVDLGTLPAGANQSDIHDAGTGLNYTVYYKFTAPANARVIGAWGKTAVANPYRAVIRAYDSAFNQILGIAGTSVPIQFPVTAGQLYYLEFAKTNDLTPATLDVAVEVAPLNTISRGNICVNDDTQGFPLAVMSHLVDKTVINFVKDIAAGESGCRLPSGPIALEDRDLSKVSFYDLSFNLILSDSSLGANFLIIRSCLGANKIYVGSRTSPSVVKSFGPNGLVIATHTLSTNQIAALAAKNDETILYYANFGVNQAIKRWDLVNDVALTDLVAAAANVTVNDILYLADDTIISVHENLVTHVVECRNYDLAGTLLHTYTCPNNIGSFSKLAYANDDTSFWSWTHDGTGLSRFQNIQVSDGTVLTDRIHREYEGGAYNGSITDTPDARFGNSFSCPFFIYPSKPGLFKVVTDKRTDNDGTVGGTVAIPTPTFKTALLP